jgi:hypothetical protein
MPQRRELSPEQDEALRQALRRARRCWNAIIDLIIAKDRAWLRGQDTVAIDAILDVRGGELAREEALIERLGGTKTFQKRCRKPSVHAQLTLGLPTSGEGA